MEIFFSITGLFLGVLATWFAYLQVKTARSSAANADGNSYPAANAIPVRPPGNGELRVVDLAELRQRGQSTRQVIMRLIEMDYDNLDGITETDVGRCETWLPIVENNPDGMRLACDRDGTIVGYWHFLPLDDEAYQAMKSVRLDDGDLRLHHLNVIGPPGDYNLYFTIICIIPEYRGVKVMRMLLDAFADTLQDLAERDIFFPEICAVAFSEEGKIMCKTLHMEKIGSHANRDPVYVLDMRRLPPGLMYRPGLRELYRNRYGSFGDGSGMP